MRGRRGAMAQERTWQQVVALVDGVFCLIMAVFCAVSGIAMVALRDSEDLAQQTLQQLPDTPTMRGIEASGVHAFLFGIGIFLLVFSALKAVHGFFAMRASRPEFPRSIGYVVFAGLFVMASLFLVVAHAINVAGGQPLEIGLLVTGILSLALSVIVLVASLGIRSQETSTISSTTEPRQTAGLVEPDAVPDGAVPPQLSKASDKTSSQRLGKNNDQSLSRQPGRTGGMPRQNPSQTGGIPRQNPSRTGGIPRQNPPQTGGMTRQNPSQTGGMPRQNPSQTGGMFQQNPSQTGGTPRQNQHLPRDGRRK